MATSNFQLLSENPDELYRNRTDTATFFFIDNCLIYTENDHFTHTRTLEHLMYKYNNTDTLSKESLDDIKYLLDPDDLIIVGKIPQEFIKFIKTVSGNVWVKYNSASPNYMSGRSSKFENNDSVKYRETKPPFEYAKNIISFWQNDNRLNETNIKNIKKLCNALDINPNETKFEFGDGHSKKETLKSWQDILNGNIKSSPDTNPIHQIIHAVTPDKKAQALKQMGAKPKPPINNIKDKYALGENFNQLYTKYIENFS